MPVAVAIVIALVVVFGLGVANFPRTGREPEEVTAAKARAASAKEAHRAALKYHDQRLKRYRRELVEAERGRRLGRVGGVTLYEHWIETPQGSGGLAGVKAHAADDTSIRQRLTVTRMLTLGVFSLAAPKGKGTGHAYVVIEGPDVSGVATLSGGGSGVGPAAYAFAAQINNAARATERAAADRAKALERARALVQRAEDRSEVMAAEAALAQALAELRALPPQTLPEANRPSICFEHGAVHHGLKAARESLWTIPAIVLPGVAVWLAFVFLALKTRSRRFTGWAAAWAVWAVGIMVVASLTHDGHPGWTAAEAIRATAAIAMWAVGIVHVTMVNRAQLRSAANTSGCQRLLPS